MSEILNLIFRTVPGIFFSCFIIVFFFWLISFLKANTTAWFPKDLGSSNWPERRENCWSRQKPTSLLIIIIVWMIKFPVKLKGFLREAVKCQSTSGFQLVGSFCVFIEQNILLTKYLGESFLSHLGCVYLWGSHFKGIIKKVRCFPQYSHLENCIISQFYQSQNTFTAAYLTNKHNNTPLTSCWLWDSQQQVVCEGSGS